VMGVERTEVGEQSLMVTVERTINSHVVAAALAVVAWYLITPPSMPNGQLDLGAPLGRWDRQQSFTSSDECKNGRERLLNLQAAPGTAARELAEMRTAVLTSQCVAAEDPRLKEK
jgi:hypothetical protein